MTDSLAAAREPADTFRPDLEGLRAVAVVLVVLYHAGVPGFGGGYGGVDVFFVLSGFLITGLLMRELGRSGTISLPGFYARRARRLLPAALLVLLATMIASAIVLPPLQVPDVGGDTAAAALYVSNLRFAFQATDYLQAQMAPSPILHFWSLGVEEQFYLFWPAIVLLVGRGARGFGTRIGATALVVSLASFVLALWLTTANEPWAFFSLPSRAWELGIGAMLAAAGSRLSSRIPASVGPWLAWVGLGLVILAAVIMTVDTPFPGTAALLPTVGAALVIFAGLGTRTGTAARLLGAPVPRFLGRISYSLYLWHWPVLILPIAVVGHALRWWERGALVGLAVVLAALTQWWVENPLRKGHLIGTKPWRNLALAGGLSFVVAAISMALGAATLSGLASKASASASADEAALHRILNAAAASPGPTPNGPLPAGLRPSLADARTFLPAPNTDGCRVDLAGTKSPPCVYGNVNGTSTVVLFGDSHALSWWPAVDRLATANGWRFVNLTKAGCGSADVAQWIDSLKRIYTECSGWRQNSLTRIAAEHPSLVILVNSRALGIVEPDGGLLEGTPAIAAWQAGLERTISELTASPGVKVAVIGDTPRMTLDAPACLSGHRTDVLACATPYGDAVIPAWEAAAAAGASAGGATFIDPTPWACPSRPCPAVIGNFLVYSDNQHLARPFAAALAPLLGPELPIKFR